MRKSISTDKIIDLAVHLSFLILLVLAFFFYKERLYADAGYYVFRVINKSGFWIEHNRFILLFSQIFPLIGVKLGLSLKAILLLYSVGHVSFFYLLFLISRYFFANRQAGLILVLMQLTGIMSGYFVPMFELYYGAGILVLFASILYVPTQKRYIITQLVLAFFILTSHPTAYFLFFYVLFLHFIKHKYAWNRQYLFYLLLVLAVFVFKKFTASEYEIGKTQAFFSTLKNGKFDLSYLGSLALFLLAYYKDLLLLLFITVVVLISSGKYLNVFSFLLVFAGLLAIANIARYGFEPTRYQEQVYFPLVFIVVYSFGEFVASTSFKSLRKLLLVFALLIIVWKMNIIFSVGMGFQERIHTMEELITQARNEPGTKFIVADKYLELHNRVEPNWSYPIETMLLSGGDGYKSVTICLESDMSFEENKEKITSEQYLFRKWELYSVKTLNEEYFRLDHGKYSRLE